MKKEIINNVLNKLSAYKRYWTYRRHFKGLLKKNHIKDVSVDGETEYVAYWKQLSPLVEKQSYRLFSHYCGKTKYIIPEDILHSYIEPQLNPTKYTFFYADKNILPQLLPVDMVPEIVLCRMNGSVILNNKYIPIDDKFNLEGNKLGDLILKPSVESSSGEGVMLFEFKNGGYYKYKTNILLTIDFLYNYGRNWVLQKAIQQSSFVSQFCKSSVNTLRICTYRSVKDEQIIILSATMRIGRDGSVVDNLHAGGGMVGIDVRTGELGKFVIDQYGRKETNLNGVSFLTEYIFPNWGDIVCFAKTIAQMNLHCRLLALDVAVSYTGKPILIEWNVINGSYSSWIPMMTGITPLGDKTDEIVEYCLAHKKVYNI